MIGHWLTDTWQRWEYGTATDAWGAPITGWTRRVDIPLRFRPLSGNHVIRDNADTVLMDAKFYMAVGAVVKVGDELRHATHGNYEVTEIINPMSMGRFLQVGGRKK